MDFLSLYLTSRLIRIKPDTKRLILGASVGAVYSVTAVAANLSAAPNAVFGTLVSIAVSLIARRPAFKGTKLRAYLIFCALFWGVSAMLGGMMTAVYSIFNNAIPNGAFLSAPNGVPNGIDKISAPYFFMLAAVSAGAALLLGRVFEKRGNVKNVEVTASINSNTVTFTALVDSGNLLREPISGMAVIVVSSDCVEKIIPKNIADSDFSISDTESDLRRRLRVIPVKGVEKCSIRYGIVPDTVTIKENEIAYQVEAVLLSEKRKPDGYGGYNATIPSVLLRG